MIPEKFKETMKPLLGEDFESFVDALENSPAVRGFRVNTLKISDGDFEKCASFSAEKIDEIPNGYIFREEKVGSDPLHHAGAFYVQDPSAMATVAAAREYIPADALMLDLCAAPGGKSTQLAALAPDGFLISNEIVPARAKILRGNIERMGVRNSAVTCADTSLFAKEFPEAFDFVLCDAPCSGEGMMRKYNEEAAKNWSEENVALCAARQKEILENAAKCTAPGGILVYSTCTFNLSENEMTVDAFLSRHGEFSLVPADGKIAAVTADGINFDGCNHDMTLCRRFYPHRSRGEGQFICIMKKAGERGARIKEKTPRSPLSKEEAAAAQAFFADFLGGVPDGYFLGMLKNTVMLCPEGAVCPKGAVFCGVAAGEVIKGRFQPHHHLFSAFGKEFLRKVCLSSTSPEALKYLRGETFSAECENGWCAVIIDGCAAGGGKAVDGTVKNHYPKGLRLIK